MIYTFESLALPGFQKSLRACAASGVVSVPDIRLSPELFSTEEENSLKATEDVICGKQGKERSGDRFRR